MPGAPLLVGATSQGIFSKKEENRHLREPTLWRTRSEVDLSTEALTRQSKPAATQAEPKPAPNPQQKKAPTSRLTPAPTPLPTQASIPQPTPAPTLRRTSAPTREPTASTEGGALRSNPSLLVGAYYYPWYLDDFHRGSYLRGKLQPQQLPVLGEYNDRDANTTRQHLEWCMGSNIFLWAMSWFGPNTRTDETSDILMNYMESQLSAADFRVNDFKVAMLYEIPSRIRLNSNIGQYDTSKVKSDIEYLASNYFTRPNYLLIDDKPVVYVYLTRLLFANIILDEVIALMRAGANSAGYLEIYIVGDHAFDDPSNLPAEYPPFALLDAVTNYDVYGSMKKPLYAGSTTVEQYFNKQKVWSDKANAAGCDFIPSTTPGFSNAVSLAVFSSFTFCFANKLFITFCKGLQKWRAWYESNVTQTDTRCRGGQLV
jgi:hypothetical protein